jgi:[acyl-carrier-protein] S-malonyltransferase
MSGILALLFPGQGAQHVGMGVDLAERWPAARRVFERASAILGIDLLAVCRDGPAEALVRTDLQQPAILAVGAAATEALRAAGALPDDRIACAFGLSLGEFTALWATGALGLEDALRVVRERGLGMQEASERVPSGMTALRCEAPEAEAICEGARRATGGVCTVANLNAPGQVVISGDIASLEAAERIAEKRGVRRPTRLPVAGAFHSPLMEPGARRLARALEGVEVRPPRVPVIPNASATPTTDPDEIRRNLLLQVTSPVRFADCVRAARALGATSAVETAPGRVLAALVRRTEPSLATASADQASAIESLVPARPGAGA